MKFSKILSTAAALILLSGCQVFFPTATPVDTPAVAEQVQTSPVSQVDGLSIDLFKDYTFFSPSLGEEVQLSNGSYEAGSGATYESLQLLDQAGFGDLNGDGTADAAVLLAENNGGSGVFVYLVALVKQADGYAASVPFLIDDRPKVESLSIANNRVVFSGSIHGLADAMANPTMQVVQEYELTRSRLTLTKLDSTISSAERSIQIDAPGEYTEVASPFTVKGSMPIGPFENTLTYRFYDSGGNLLIEAPLSVQSDGVGGPATFDAQIELPKANSGTSLLFVLAEQSMANGADLCLNSVNLVVK